MYDPDRDYEHDGRQSVADPAGERFADMFERSVWCMRCGVQLDRFTWAVVAQAVFCQTCVDQSPYNCLDSIVCLKSIDWTGLMKVAHQLLWLSPDDPVYHGYAASVIATWTIRRRNNDRFFGDGPFAKDRDGEARRAAEQVA